MQIVSTDASGSNGELYVDGIFSRFAPGSAFQSFGGYTFLKNCTAHAPAIDCFNYNESTGGNFAYVIEQDCRGTCAGDIATQGTGISVNRNGSSVHDNVDILRIGGYYEENWGPQIADVANADTGTSWNIGVTCGPTTEPQSIGFYSSDTGRKVYYDGCYAYGNTTAVSSVTSTAKQTGCVFDGATVGVVGTYDPETGS